ncbi:hypothetical protein EOD40_06435 [Flavobacterium sufflavum]|uniref:Uncharacterized protein n=1 Tax=Flavobacterium sufflavum TaxID=1921138 RepID=A0A3S2U6R4_9FLAO|nr:hypothetical protein [Flavobacterium sufflavum]RVT77439.1 hypothetical protein EOD40_06435 [Flavobacterium sufflavum]
MKLIARFFLFLFIAFLSTPTIIKLIEKSTDTSMFYSMSEEELAKKEVKHILYIAASTSTFELKTTVLRSLILSENLSKHDNVSRTIFTPPPDRA